MILTLREMQFPEPQIYDLPAAKILCPVFGHKNYFWGFIQF
jgi:hypothetical protein